MGLGLSSASREPDLFSAFADSTSMRMHSDAIKVTCDISTRTGFWSAAVFPIKSGWISVYGDPAGFYGKNGCAPEAGSRGYVAGYLYGVAVHPHAGGVGKSAEEIRFAAGAAQPKPHGGEGAQVVWVSPGR